MPTLAALLILSPDRGKNFLGGNAKKLAFSLDKLKWLC
jgi:hypothetical protein